MNIHLQQILNTIKEDKNLSEEEKNVILKSLKNADKEFEITNFKLDRTEKVKRTTAILLEETIEELEQKRKAIEEKNHELEIENALEKVRAIALSMKEPADMPEVCKIIATELDKLGLKEIRNVQTAIFYESKGTYMNYEYYSKHDKTIITEVSYTNHTMHQAFADQMLKGKGEFFSTHMSKDELPGWIAYQKTTNVFIDNYIETASSLNYYWYSLGPVALGISTYVPLTEAEINLFKRFLKVFELAYKRYLDIENAEAQAREAKIQLALERVRARTMAMQRSDELPEAANLLFQQVLEMGMPAWSAGYCIWDEEKKAITLWMSSESVMQPPFRAPLTEDPSFIHMLDAHERGETFYVEAVGGDELVQHYKYMRTLPVVGEILDSIINAGHPLPTFQIFHLVFFSQGFLLFITYEPVPNAHGIFKRFGKVFDQTYTRFLDLQKAEAQAKEGQIEASLERVRSRSMGMQKSEELKEVIQVVYEQFVHLNILIEHTGFIVDYKERDDMHIWLADKHEVPSEVTFPYFDSPHWNSFIDAKEKGMDFFANYLSFEEKNRFYQQLFKLFPVPDEAKEYYFNCPGLAISTVLLENVGLYIENFSGIPYSDEENNTLMRFGKVFQQTYTRFLDLQKAEAQAREAQIEAALERVRSRSLAMHKSDELEDVIRVVSEQLQQLQFSFHNVSFAFNNEHMGLDFWLASPADPHPLFIKVPYLDNPSLTRTLQARAKGDIFFADVLTADENHEWIQHVIHHSSLKGVSEENINFLLNTKGYARSTVLMKHIILAIGNYFLIPYTDEQNAILKRFGNVFEQSYTRFLDLQKAEAQAREAQIEVSLERVRSKAMAMQKSEDLANAVAIVFEELDKLDLGMLRCGIGIINKKNHSVNVWASTKSDKDSPVQVSGDESMDTHPLLRGAFNAWLKQEEYSYILHGKDLTDYYRTQVSANFKLPDSHSLVTANEDIQQYYFLATFQAGGLFAFRETVFSEEAKVVMKRFADVFNLTYTRFSDLQKAEAQARESQIELSLERLRAKTMAMHNSADVGETAAVMVDELKKLGIETMRCGIGIMHEPGDMEVWTISTDDNNKTSIIIGWLDMNMHPLLHGAFESWRNKIDVYSYELKDDDLLSYYNAINNYPGYPIRYDTANLPKQIHHNEFHFAEGTLFAFSLQQLSEEQRKIFKRFAGVFGQTYRRYLDLKKAEAQAREAQIEAALEKVRSNSLAMHQSSELQDVVNIVFERLSELNIQADSVSVIVLPSKPDVLEYWLAVPNQRYATRFHIPHFENTIIARESITAWQQGKGFAKCYTGIEKNEHWNYLFEHSDLKNLPADRKEFLLDTKAYNVSLSFTANTALQILRYNEEIFSEKEREIFQRFANVFEQAYTRFLDLKKAEAQAKEAQVEAALERVRSRTLAMQKSGELAETSAVLFKQLISLGIEPNRLYISIMKDDEGETEFWISDEDGSKVSSAYTDNLNTNASFKKMYDGWKEGKQSMIIDMQGKELQEYFQHLTSLNVPFKDGLQQQRRIQHLAYFNRGFIGMAAPDDQPEETIHLLERFAAVFNLTFTRFNDLKIAEAHAIKAEEDLIEIKAARKKAEEALSELQVTQNQLIQKEKMASLGELTAGIAHEIQNPLNFVNNFSEVSKELLDEMKAALDKGDKDEAEEIANDIIKNLEKINHHGKRADAIVKGMLQHSQRSSGQKELTDINTLCDEYLRLSYHGLRAKDKNFNADFKTDFDENIGKISIVPQDIGRVLLNLYNNAFYACTERSRSTTNTKRKTADESYKPLVLVSTKKINDKIEIKVTDNGNGIPQNIVDKIFQPFFTTKPTGQGTGLGLSLSYDIIKAHGGEIKVETEEGEGTTFTIQLHFYA
ncbi:MAG: ATP-binding protein [Ginsengibacter sp.]